MDLIKGYTVPIYKDGKFITHSLIKDIESIMTNFLIDLRNTLKDWLGDLLPIDNIKKLQKFNDSIIYLINANLSNARCKWAKIEVKLLLNKEIILTKNSNIFDAYNKLPSDTRPGFNTSSLIIHQISTSALAYAIATHDGKLTTEEIQLLRTGCLFHDIGKPFIWAKHAAVGAEKFQEFFGEFFTDDYLQKILLLIKGHMDSQQKRDTRWYIHHADILSASSDRLTIILSKLFGDHFPWMKDPTEFRKFERWNSIKNNFGKMTDEYVNNYTKIFNELFKNIPETEGDQIGLVIGDIRKIKTYVDHVNRVAELKGASSLVDEILQDVVISLTQEKQIPPENIIFFGGGNIFFICDGKSSKELTNFIEIKFKESFKGGLRLTAENYKIDYNYKGAFGQAYTWLMLKLNKKKKELKNVWTRTLPGAFKLCQSCGIHLAEKIIIFSEGEKDFYCESCIQKFEKGRDPYVGFAALWKPFAEKLNYPWRAIREKLLEFIAGHTIEDIEKMKKKDIPIRRLDVAVIKADGNLMGEFMADSASLTDLIERNIRIDRCMDIVFQEITSSIKNLNNIQ
ncbi:MAG: HD domain-containing protein, partial [Promethearchaeota archaeon]